MKPCELKAKQCKRLFSFNVRGVVVLISTKYERCRFFEKYKAS
jgi:hypothetical protein